MSLPGNRRILVVDDDSGIRLLLAAFLRRRGYQLLEARNGREALKEMRGGRPDLVIMDLLMPEVSGWDVLRERAGDRALQQIPMIVITANNVRDVIADVGDKYVFAVLGKPFDLDVLLTTVTKCLEHSNATAPAAA
jgi:two-component system response regulator MprA